MMKILILGAGLTGLELGRRLKEINADFLILEKEDEIGGLCRTNRTGEYRWDFGGHAIYSRDQAAMDYFLSLPLNYARVNRNVRILHTGSDGKRRLINYPFEVGIRDLPLKDMWECLWGYLLAYGNKNKNYADLEEWIIGYLGRGTAKHFMIPYNSKIWSCALSEISEKLVYGKIEPEPPLRVILSVLGKKVVGRAYQARFIYPKEGVGEIPKYIAKGINDKIILNAEVQSLQKVNGKWSVLTASGARYEADTVISTIPLPELLKKVNINGLEKRYDALRWNDTYFIMVGLEKGRGFNLIGNCQWVFFKEEEIFYRLTLTHNFSMEFPPVLVAEITQKGAVARMTGPEIERLVIKDIIRLKIVDSEDHIARTDVKLIQYTYPIPTVNLEAEKKKIHSVLEGEDLFLLGRSGNWEYLNMDSVILKVRDFLKNDARGLTQTRREIDK
jgi:protoporphyrinogen oxidase